MSVLIVIPARYASTRLPGKPLHPIAGRSMLERVLANGKQAAQLAGECALVVATDDERIAAAVESFGGQACMTDAAHRSGTDRILEVTRTREYETTSVSVRAN